MKKLTNLFCHLVVLFLLCSPAAFAQSNVNVSGRVTDEAGQPIIGAGVMLSSDQTVGTTTDLDGNYSLSIPSNATLVISCIGYQTERVAVAGRSEVNVTMREDAEFLEETVVVGYGVQRKSDITGAIASVGEADLQNRTVTNAAAALQGKASGVQILNFSAEPGAESNIRVRGYSSNSSNIGPLLIVDGLQVDNINYLDPSMIESMEVLKDAASAAIYGAQAGNGVVLITTKQGERGRGTITYDVKLIRNDLAKVPEIMNAAQFIDYKRMSGIDIDSMLESYNYDGTDTDWINEFFGPSFTQQHSLSFSGGNNNGHYYMSLNYIDNNGIIRGDRDTYKRLSYQLNADYKIKDWFTVGTNTSIERNVTQSASQHSESGVMISVLQADPLTPVYYYDPSEFTNLMQQTYAENPDLIMKAPNGAWWAVSPYVETYQGNPFLQLYRGTNSNERINIRGTVYANLTPIEGLVFTSRFGYRLSQSASHSYSTPYFASSMSKDDNYSISASTSVGRYYQWENFANYSKTLGKHTFGIMAGMSYIENNYDGVSASAQGPDILKGYDSNFQYLNYVNNNANTAKSFSNAPSKSASISYYGRLTYNYDDRYNVQAIFRADAYDSSKLSRQARWGYFPSFSAGWTISNERFIKDNVSRDMLSLMKLRASWGRNGNVNVLNNYQYATTISKNGSWYQYDIADGVLSYGSGPSGLANPDLKWETSEQIDVGLDTRFFSDRLTFTADYFYKTTKDLLISITPVAETGISSTTINAGRVLNTGLELEASWRDNIGDFNYSVSANFSTLNNRVTYLDPSVSRIESDRGQFATFRNAFEVGYPIWYFRGYQYDGVDHETGEPIYHDFNGDGTINDEDRTYIGKGIPDYTYGITVNLSYKGFDFLLFGTGVGGNDIFSILYRADRPFHNSLAYYYENAWTPDNKDATMPAPSTVASSEMFWSSSAQVFNGAYFKIKQIQLGYTIPENITKRFAVSRLRIYASLDDYFTITSYPGLDPETASSGTSNMGVDMGSYPTSKKLVFGVNLTF